MNPVDKFKVVLVIIVGLQKFYSAYCQLLSNIQDYATLDIKHDEGTNKNWKYMTVASTQVKLVIGIIK